MQLGSEWRRPELVIRHAWHNRRHASQISHVDRVGLRLANLPQDHVYLLLAHCSSLSSFVLSSVCFFDSSCFWVRNMPSTYICVDIDPNKNLGTRRWQVEVRTLSVKSRSNALTRASDRRVAKDLKRTTRLFSS